MTAHKRHITAPITSKSGHSNLLSSVLPSCCMRWLEMDFLCCLVTARGFNWSSVLLPVTLSFFFFPVSMHGSYLKEDAMFVIVN